MKGVWKFVGGCFVGAASAIVVSPKSGREVRRQIVHRLAAGLERTGAEGDARTQAREAAPVWLEEPLPAPPVAESAAVAEPEPVRAAVEPEPVVVVVAREPIIAIATPEPEIAVMVPPEPIPEPEPVVVVVAPEPIIAIATPEPEIAVRVAPEPIPEPEPVVVVVAPEPIPELTIVAEEPAVTALEPEPVIAPAPLVEAAAFDDLITGPLAPTAPPPGEPLEHPGLEDLRARIEQTKAAVREALERPFAAEEGATAGTPEPAAEPAVTESVVPAEPQVVAVTEPVIAAEPLVAPDPEIAVMVPEPAVLAPAPVVAEAPEVPEFVISRPTSPEEELVAEIETTLEPSLLATMPAAPSPSPPEGAGVWVSPEPPVAPPVVVPPVVEAPAAMVPEDETVDLGPELRSTLAEVPMGQIEVVAAAVPVVAEEPPPPEPQAPPEETPAPVRSSLDQAVAEAFSFDETGEPPVEPPVVDQAEMRRRIEETRARLKAKAFDAMTSGESALLSREPGESAPPQAEEPKEADVQLDDEVRQAIERSLSQDDV